MTTEELVDRLAPVRLPEDFARFGLQDGLAALSLGLLVGLALAGLLRLVTRPRLDAEGRARREIERLAGLDDEPRLVGLARLLDAHGAARPEGLDRALYGRGAGADIAALERAVLAAARRRA